ncbi:MAG: 4Fe-4S dicluster domain-containing protein [Methanosarcinales archaeon]|nr:4Fe-4S dicluster domain-containing protein [ANME-2 cluster archaeon]MDW7776140.1 4Fe-4S dicluster domain-containing protein [Methanosarcinales archaeon]
MTRYAMVIDLQKCGGCGSCIIACKNENNLTEDIAWSSKINKTSGTFPNVKYEYLPTLCNHCENAPCVEVCPTTAMHKIEGDITMHDPDKCRGCKKCMRACPYGVIFFNDKKPHNSWNDNQETIRDCTSSPVETARTVGEIPPYYNPDRAETLPGIRPIGVVEKCTLCDHRVKHNLKPYCVERCPARGRVFGDLDDPASNVNQLLAKYSYFRLREEEGTEPKVFYIRSFSHSGHV